MATEDDPIGEIHRAIITVSRSARIQAIRESNLSLVALAILSYVDNTADPTATDLAGEYGLDKSTVSRQLADLERQALLRRVPDATRARMQLLKLTAKGRRCLSAARTSQRKRLGKKLGNWPAADVVAFSRLLSRFASATNRPDNSET